MIFDDKCFHRHLLAGDSNKFIKKNWNSNQKHPICKNFQPRHKKGCDEKVYVVQARVGMLLIALKLLIVMTQAAKHFLCHNVQCFAAWVIIININF